MARPTFAKLMATPDARFVWPMYSPVGMRDQGRDEDGQGADHEVLEEPVRDAGRAVQFAGSRKKSTTPSISAPPP